MPDNFDAAKKAVMEAVLNGHWGDLAWMKNLSGTHEIADKTTDQILSATGFLGANVNAAIESATGSNIESHLLKALEHSKTQPEPEQKQELEQKNPFAEIVSGVANIVIAAVGAPVKTLARFFDKSAQKQEKKPEEEKQTQTQIQPQAMQENLARLAPEIQQAVLNLSASLQQLGFAEPQKTAFFDKDKDEEKDKKKGEEKEKQPMSLGMDIGNTPIGKALDDSEASYGHKSKNQANELTEAASVLRKAGVTRDDSAASLPWTSRICGARQKSEQSAGFAM